MAEVEQKVTKWAPSPLQAKVLATAIEYEGKPTVTAICEAAGVTRKTYYEWRRESPEFREQYDSLWSEALKGSITTAVKALVCEAETGDVAAIRLTMELAGLLKPKGDGGTTINNSQTNVFVNLDFSKLTPDELREYRAHCLAIDSFRRRIGIVTEGAGGARGASS